MLSKEVREGKTVHAYLFIGPRGTGKTTTARVLAKALNCKRLHANGDPCDKCDACVSIREGSYVDLIEIDAASNRGIDDIRDLKDKVRLAPARGKRKMYIIDEVHMLTAEAFNALLKTLEEPPKNVTFILCTTESHKVPETIKSRCQVFKFKRATIGQIVTRLKDIAKSENIKTSDEVFKKIASASSGGFRDAETLFQQVAEGDLNVESLLGISSKDIYVDFVDDLIKKDAKKAIKIVNKVFEEGIDLYLWSGELLKYLRDLLFIKSGSSDQIEETTGELLIDMRRQAQLIPLDWLIKLMKELIETQRETKNSSLSQLPLELFIASLCGEGESKGSDNSDRDDSEDTDEKAFLSTGTVKAIKAQDTAVKENKKDTRISVKNVIALETLEEKWKDLLKKSKELNHSIAALLKSGKVTGVEGHFLIFEVFYPFHKERLESPKNKKMIEDLLMEFFEIPLKVKCVVSKDKPVKEDLKKGESGLLTDYNVALLDIFDGGVSAIR